VSNQRIVRLVRLTCLTTKNPSDIARRVIQGFDYSIEYVAFPDNTYLAHVHISPRGVQSQAQAVGELLQRLVEALSPRYFTITVYYNSSTRVLRNRVPSPGDL
jgi:NADPH-dependent 7-cyano-7-deazaguanine reductase QueF